MGIHYYLTVYSPSFLSLFSFIFFAFCTSCFSFLLVSLLFMHQLIVFPSYLYLVSFPIPSFSFPFHAPPPFPLVGGHYWYCWCTCSPDLQTNSPCTLSRCPPQHSSHSRRWLQSDNDNDKFIQRKAHNINYYI